MAVYLRTKDLKNGSKSYYLDFYHNNSPSRPARSVLVNATLDTSVSNFRESGPFLRFCELAINALPLPVQAQVTRNGGSIADLLRSVLAGKTAT